MYSRQNRPSGNWQVPKNYSGNVFSPSQGDDIFANTDESISQDQDVHDDSGSSPASAVSFEPKEKKSGLFGLSRKGGGIGFEELLILGLVLLISQSDEGESNNDLAFLLLLLLFIQ